MKLDHNTNQSRVWEVFSVSKVINFQTCISGKHRSLPQVASSLLRKTDTQPELKCFWRALTVPAAVCVCSPWTALHDTSSAANDLTTHVPTDNISVKTVDSKCCNCLGCVPLRHPKSSNRNISMVESAQLLNSVVRNQTVKWLRECLNVMTIYANVYLHYI